MARSLASDRALAWIVPAVIVLIAAVCFAPVLQNDFVNWDDRVNLLENRHYRGLSVAHLQWMFTTFHNSLYRPLTWMTLGADYLLWGMNPSGYHLTSLVFHCAATFLFYFLSVRVLLLIGPAAPGSDHRAVKFAAAVAALIFAVHPLRVEPIAWASGRENVVAGPFFILTLICYLRAVENEAFPSSYWKWMSAAWLSYTFSLLGKGAGVTLPIVLLLLDIYPLRRLGGGPSKSPGSQLWRLGWEKAPFFFLALVAGVLAVYGKQQSKLMYGIEEYGIAERLVQAMYGVIFYLWKTLIPLELSNLYEMETLSLLDRRFILSGLLLVAITAGLWTLRQLWPWGLVAWVGYAVILLPYIGVAQNGPQIAADRYTYLACLVWSWLAGDGVLYCWRAHEHGKIGRPAFLAFQATILLVVVWLGWLTWKQTQIWRDSETLWRHALAINPESFFAHLFLATALMAKDKPNEAIHHFHRSLEINRSYASAHTGLANVLAENGNLDQAVEHYHKALQLDRGSMEAHYNLGRILARRGETDQAMLHYSRALAINPDDADTHNNLGLLVAARGDAEQAIAHFRQALEVDPRHAKAHFNLGRLLLQQRSLNEAVHHFQIALQLQPGVAEIHEQLGRALSLQGKKDEAAEHLAEAVKILKSQQSRQE
jgi:tetratricopeptide (TPR) repeat protein